MDWKVGFQSYQLGIGESNRLFKNATETSSIAVKNHSNVIQRLSNAICKPFLFLSFVLRRSDLPVSLFYSFLDIICDKVGDFS